jgi:exosome complex RNA-binding protein Rrp4
VDQEQVISSVAGTIERVNKLVTVRAIRTRYNPEVGDLVVGRITEVFIMQAFKTQNSYTTSFRSNPAGGK